MKIPKEGISQPSVGPSWLAMVVRHDDELLPARPVIRCRCGQLMSISKHHVHSDGRVTASFLHPECGFHEMLELADYTGPDFPPQ